MDLEQGWRLVAAERIGLADLLEDLADEEWERPSLCEGWRVRDVAAHLALGAHPPRVGAMLVEALRAQGRPDRASYDLAIRHAGKPTAELVAELRQHAAARKLAVPVVTNYQHIVIDVLVHGQDIAVPLGRKRAMPLGASRDACEFIWRTGWPFWAKRKLRGCRLTSTDTDWTAGKGATVAGPIAALMLLLTGRRAALASLTGDGRQALAARMAPARAAGNNEESP